MTSSSIKADTKSIKTFLSEGAKHRFIIPQYQRPYAWTLDEVTTLFTDLWEFADRVIESDDPDDESYFLGSIVSYNTDKTREIIDGQQRITSLFLLLRAIYTELTKPNTKTQVAQKQIQDIQSALWKTNRTNGEVDFDTPLLVSNVVSEEKNQILARILSTGEVDEKAKDPYSTNYRAFQKLYADAVHENPSKLVNFIDFLLFQAILLPIEANSQDSALTIFSTLNNRGLPLSDADIFKAQIYNDLKNPNEKEEFIQNWKLLDENLAEIGETIQQFFYYYMFVIRAREDDRSPTTPGLRKYFSHKGGHHLNAKSLDELNDILNLWRVIKRKPQIVKETWAENIEILQALDILNAYPNDFWKYPVINYYLRHRHSDEFESHFLVFLRKLIAGLLSKHLFTPYTTAVKADVLKLNAATITSMTPAMEFDMNKINSLKKEISEPPRSAFKILLTLLAYIHDEQTQLLPAGWQIEHILPQSYKKIQCSDSESRIKENMEHLGNKLPLEEKLNIKGSDKYFGRKKDELLKSKIAVAKALAETEANTEEWTVNHIIKRDSDLEREIRNTLKKWANSIWTVRQTEMVTISKEEYEKLILANKKS